MACNMKTHHHNSENKDDYETWRKDLELGIMYADMPKENWGYGSSFKFNRKSQTGFNNCPLPAIN